MNQRDLPPSIGEHAVIGDTRTAALVSRDGSIDWLCLPRFDSPATFASILDVERGGSFAVSPIDGETARRSYLPGTNVVETTIRTVSGEAVVRDAMTLALPGADRLAPDHEVLREIEGIRGTVDVAIRYAPRASYGRLPVGLEPRPGGILSCQAGEVTLTLSSEVPLAVSWDRASATGTFTIHPGERRYLSLAADVEAPAVIPGLGEDARTRLRETADWWRSWSAACAHDGPYREHVVRSALVLKLLAFSPSGAIVAAPTTSLPEVIGGERNWDYRFCWLRDAAFVMRALDEIGFRREADAFFAWMLHATRLTHPELRVVYDVYGRTGLDEHELGHLDGYRDSRPVRVGNAAGDQFQLDVYGEVLDAAERYANRGGVLDRDQVAMLEGFADTVCRRWMEPDDGIWETRGDRRHYVHSKVLCWVGLDRLVRMHERGHVRTDVERFRRVRDEIRAAIERDGVDRTTRSYVREFGRRTVDSSLLTLPLLDYLPGDDPRMRATFRRVTSSLATGPLYRRYEDGTDDGLAGREATFGICSFWAVECRALAGDVDGAVRAFEELLGYANDAGLYGEEIDPDTGAALGNFPQALTHIGLINAALTIERQKERR